MGQKSAWVLPIDPDPPTTRCYMITVPNEIQHLAAFRGALFELCKAYSWQNDEAHTALLAAERWKEALETLTECDMGIQFRQPDICTLEVSFDGVTWTQIYTAEVCVTNGVNDIIQGYLDDGTLAPGGQPGPAEPPEQAMCKTFVASMDANGLWKLPMAVDDGWTIRTYNISGSAWDGVFDNLWNCPNGKRLFFTANCNDGLDTPGESTDPLPSAQHMRLIARIGSVYTDMFEATYVVPDGTGQSDVIFQANDGTLADNAGAYQFAVEVCNYQHIDGCTDPADFVAANWQRTSYFVGHAVGTWISAGVSEDTPYPSPSSLLWDEVAHTFATPVTVTKVVLESFLTGNDPNRQLDIAFYNAADAQITKQHYAGTPGAIGAWSTITLNATVNNVKRVVIASRSDPGYHQRKRNAYICYH